MKKSKGAGRRKPGYGGKLALAIVTCVNLVLTLALSVQRRRDVVRALREDGKVRLLLEQAESERKES